MDARDRMEARAHLEALSRHPGWVLVVEEVRRRQGEVLRQLTAEGTEDGRLRGLASSHRELEWVLRLPGRLVDRYSDKGDV